MKHTLALILFISFNALADFSTTHTGLCAEKSKCNIVISPLETVEVSARCEGKLADIACRVLVLKTSDSASMNLLCGDLDAPIVSQVLEAEVMSYQVSALTMNSSGDFSTTVDPNEYHLVSNPALNVQLASGEDTKAIMILTLQDRAIPLTDVVCE